MASRCQAIRHRNPKTGKPVSTLNGLLLLAVAGLVMLCIVGRKLVVDLRMASYALENLLYWITCIVVPAVSVVTIIVIFRRNRFRIEAADPPIWGEAKTELSGKWYSVARHSRDGRLCSTWYQWPATTILTSNEAWLLNSQGVYPVLIQRSWLTLDQQTVMDQFVDALSQWRFSPAAHYALANLSAVLPPLPTDGVPFNRSTHQPREFARLLPEICVLFPELQRPTLFFKRWFWNCWAVGMFLCASCSPAYVLLTREGTIHFTSLLPGLAGWMIYQIGKSGARNAAQNIVGVITDSAVWLEIPAMRSAIRLQDFSQCRIVSDVLLLSTEKSKTPFCLFRSSFATEADWRSARQLIDTAVRSRTGGDKEDGT